MNKIAKYLKNTPVIIIWLWLFVFFADSANLDDFCKHITVIHTDDPTDNVTDEYPGEECVDNDNQLYSNIPLNTNLIQTNKIVFDQDSPSLSPDFNTQTVCISENSQNKKVSLISISLIKVLYLEFHSLLI